MGVASIPQHSERGALAGDKAARIIEALGENGGSFQTFYEH